MKTPFEETFVPDNGLRGWGERGGGSFYAESHTNRFEIPSHRCATEHHHAQLQTVNYLSVMVEYALERYTCVCVCVCVRAAIWGRVNLLR